MFKSTNPLPKDQQQTKVVSINGNETLKPNELEKSLEDEFKDLHLNLPVLEVPAHAHMYNAILNKYVKSLELGKNGSTYVQNEIPKKLKDPRLFIFPCRLRDSKSFDTLADLGSYVNLIPLSLYNKLKIRLLEETEAVLGLADGSKAYPVRVMRDVEVRIGWEKDTLGPETPFYLKNEFMITSPPGAWEITKDVLVFRKMVKFIGAIPINLKSNKWESEDMFHDGWNWKKPPQEGDGA
ncbi:MAK10-like protein [Tanacetum coccineum]|uniref:MAK10-like protein n=1 Tax=Tanacetum coccineum TaxID=301880 RepID=A0ABQ4WKK7_9ASTR